MGAKSQATPGGLGFTPVTFQEAGNQRGREEHTSMGSRYETFTMDYDWAQQVRGSLLGLENGATPSQKDIDTSEHFVPRAAASELEPPKIIVDHWLPILWEHSHLVECHPDKFTAAVDWVPLYKPDSLWRHLPLSAFVNTGPPSLTAVVPPEICMGPDREFLLTNFHQHECLMRQSISIGARRRQLAFCPYCGVVNDNSETAM